MPSISRLVWRGDVFYFRMAVPRRLVSRLQRSEVKASLQTTDPLAAKVRVRLLSNALDVLFSEAESMAHISIPTINERIRGYFQECLNRSLEHTQLLPMDPAGDVGAEIAGLRESVEAMRKQLQTQSFSHSVVEAATSLLEPPRVF